MRREANCVSNNGGLNLGNSCKTEKRIGRDIFKGGVDMTRE